VQADTTLVLGLAERDLTGDGRPETLRVIARGRTADSLSVTFTIESSGAVVYQTDLSPITRVVGLDAGRRASSQADRESLLRYYKVDFFGESKFTTPAEFLSWLERSAPGRIAEIPVVLGQDRRRQLVTDSLETLGRPVAEISSRVRGLRREPSDSVSGAAIWDAIRQADATVFQFPLGGDGLSAIAWSAADRRFYRLFECC
jgi:hypothetical protein